MASPTTTRPDQRNDIVMPLVALALACAGFVLFGGSRSTVRENGVVTSESSLNVLGIILAVAAIALAVKHLRMRGGAANVRRPLCAFAIVVAVFQIVYSLGVF